MFASDSEKFKASLFREYIHETYMANLFMHKFGSDYTALFEAMARDAPRNPFHAAFFFRKNLHQKHKRQEAFRLVNLNGDVIDPELSRTVIHKSAKDQADEAAEVEKAGNLDDEGEEQVCTL